jgi:hypothetical protein
MDYSKKLQNPNWQRKRLEILNRDNFQCIACGSKDKELHVHHRWYIFGNDIWDYPDICFETLCHECHTYIELHIKEATHDINLELRRSILDQSDYSCILNLLNSISYNSDYSKYSPIQIADAIHYINENNLIGKTLEMRAYRFK